MKTAIIGGAGFIGSALAALLVEQGHEIVILDTQKSALFPDHSLIVDVTNKDALCEALAGCGAIYHLAAEHRDDVRPVRRYYDVNVEGGRNVAEAAAALDIKTIIFTSSVAVYGLDNGESREADAAAPFNDYGQSKLESEKIFESWAAEDKSRTLVTIRLVATFGPGNRGNIYTLIERIARGGFIMVGSGRNKKSIAYVGNVAAFLAQCLERPPGIYLYNYADKPDLSMKDMVADIRAALGYDGPPRQIPYALGLMGGIGFDLAASVSGKTFPISAIRVKKFCASTVVNADRLKETGFQAPYSLREGLLHMIEAEFPQKKNRAA